MRPCLRKVIGWTAGVTFTAALVGGAILVWRSRGPLGSEIAKDVDWKIESALRQAGLHLAATRSVPATDVALPSATALRYRAKRVAGFLGVALTCTDDATDYSIRPSDDHERMECF